jgi:signal peptidase I
MRDGLLLRNGRPQREPFVAGRGNPVDAVRDTWGPLVVPPGHLFVLGDNRGRSLDSRYWGFVPDSLLRGTPWLVYYSFAPDSTAPAAWLTRIRWQRIGSAVRP